MLIGLEFWMRGTFSRYVVSFVMFRRDLLMLARTLIIYYITFLPRNSPHYGELSLRSKNFKPPGKLSAMTASTHYIGMRLETGWKSLGSTTRVSMKSLVISFRSVSFTISTAVPILIMSNEVLHPYFKLAYIKLAWGGAEEQAAERAAGNKYAKNWQDEARKIVEREVSRQFIECAVSMNYTLAIQLELYWRTRPHCQATPLTPAATSQSTSLSSDFDLYRQTLVAADHVEGWEAELRRYLNDMPADVTPETDVVKYWEVCTPFPISDFRLRLTSMQ
jgi:hypothetical protein